LEQPQPYDFFVINPPLWISKKSTYLLNSTELKKLRKARLSPRMETQDFLKKEDGRNYYTV
jgi:hypothetical protein